MQGVELVDPTETGPMGVADAPDPTLAKHVAGRLREAGVIMGVGGFYKNVTRFQPPLTITRDELKRAVAELGRAIEAETN